MQEEVKNTAANSTRVLLVGTRVTKLLPTPVQPPERPVLRCYDHSKPGKFLTFLTAYFVTTKFCLEQIFIIFVNFRCFSRRIKKFHGKMLFCSYSSQTPKFIIFQKKISVFFFFRIDEKKIIPGKSIFCGYRRML